MYKATQDQQASSESKQDAGKSSKNTNTKTDDDISDVDFEEVKDDEKK